VPLTYYLSLAGEVHGVEHGNKLVDLSDATVALPVASNEEFTGEGRGGRGVGPGSKVLCDNWTVQGRRWGGS